MKTGSRCLWRRVRPAATARPSFGLQQLAIGLLLSFCFLVAAPAAAQDASATALYERGARALRAGDATQAIDFLSEAAKQEPDRWDILALYARALLIAGQNRASIEVFDRVAQLNPNAKDIDYYRGIAAYRLGRWQDTLRYLDAVSPERNASGRVHLYKGIAYQERKQYAEATAELTEAGRLDPTLRGATAYRMGVMALERKNVDEGRKYLLEVEEAVPGSALARSARGYLDQIDSGLYRPFALYARLGGGYDSNASLQTGEFEGLQELQTGVGSGEFGVNGLLIDSERFDVRVGASGYLNFHGSGPAKLYDQIIATGFALSSFELSPRARLGVGYTFEYVWANYSEFRVTHAPEVSLRFIPLEGFVTNVFYGVQSRDYLFNLDERFADLNRDGWVQRAGFDQLWYTPNWTGWGKNYVIAGFRFRRESSKGTEYDSDGFAPQIGIGVSLPRKMFWTASFSYEWRNFEHQSCLFGYTIPLPAGYQACDTPPIGTDDRKDKIARVTTNLRIPVIQEVFVDFTYGFTHRDSNTPFYRFSRHLAQFIITYRY